METGLLIWILITLALSAFFSGIEIAFVTADKLQLELKAKNIPLAGKVISWFIKKPSQFMGTTLVGNTAALVFYSMLIANFLFPIMQEHLPETFRNEFSFLIIQTIISTIIVLFMAEFIPKSVFLINPIKMVSIFSFPLSLAYIILYLPMIIIIALSRFILTRIFKLEYSDEQPAFGLTDLNNYVKKLSLSDSGEGKVEVDTKILHNALEFKTVRVRDCMVPRTEISAVHIHDSIELLTKEFVESGHSKILIYRSSIDDVVGYCHLLEVFKKPESIEQIMVPIIIVPETMMANELMVQFISERKSIALVVDEYGGTSGVVSMEDIMEEIFGEIQDEHDEEELTEYKLDDNNYILNARLEVDYLNDKYGWTLPEGEYETLGGLVYAIAEDIPKPNDTIEFNPYRITINTMYDTRIGNVTLTIKEGGNTSGNFNPA
ncbi:MAG: hemolysin family protein [Cyclobacteriaceae bacterium]|nr:hemolysin family protein [Cyclobacteriaceae bacterium]